MSENGEIYTAGKNFTLPPALTGWTNSTSDSSLFLDLDISRLVVDYRHLGHVRVPRILARTPASQLLRVLVRRELLQTYPIPSSKGLRILCLRPETLMMKTGLNYILGGIIGS